MKRFVKIILATGLIALGSQSFAATKANNAAANSANVSPAERAKIESVIHDYLLQKPEVLVQALQILQQRQYQEAEKTVKQTQSIASNYADKLFHQSTDPVAGNPDGAVTVVEFFDYQCPHCVDMAPVISDIIKSNPNVRIVFKDFPIRGPMSEVAARAALAANKQGKYYEFSHALLTAKTQLNEDVIYKIAKDNGLDVDQLKKDMNDTAVKNELNSNLKLAQDLKLFGTPALFIGKTNANGKTEIVYFPGHANTAQLQEMIDKAAK